MLDNIVIVGGGQAALSCIARLRDGGHAGSITLIGDEWHLPYQRPPLSKAFLLGKTDASRLELKSREYYDKNNVVLKCGVPVTLIERHNRRVVLASGEVVDYTKLVLATGSRARTLAAETTRNLEGIFTLRSISDAGVLQSALEGARDVVVIGGGYVGLEVAAVSKGLGCNVTLLESADRILNRVASLPTAEQIGRLHAKNGVTIMTSVRFGEFLDDDGRVTGVALQDGTVIPADVAIVGIGGVANDELGSAAGLTVANGIVVNTAGQTSDPDIYAAGDCALFPFDNRMVRLESVQNAVDQGAAVADAILGREAEYTPLPWFWSDQFDAKLQTVGLAIDYDEVLPMSAVSSENLAVWYLRSGKVIAVDTINDARTHMAAKRLLGLGVEIKREQILSPQFNLVDHMRSLTRSAP